MKKIYRPLIKGTNWALAGLLTLFGFTHCNDDGIGETPAMYGVPWKGYAIKGTVVDKNTRQPIPNMEIKVAFPDSIYQKAPSSGWRDTTDVNGEFELLNTPSYNLEGESDVPLAINNLNEEINGIFAPDTVTADFEKAEHIGGGDGWFQGWMTATTDIELEKKDQE